MVSATKKIKQGDREDLIICFQRQQNIKIGFTCIKVIFRSLSRHLSSAKLHLILA